MRSLVLDIDIGFGHAGNACAFARDGWSVPEDGFMWSLGPRSTIVLHPAPHDGDYLIALAGRPYLVPPRVTRQHFSIHARGREIGSGSVQESFTTWFAVPGALARAGELALVLSFPDCTSLSHGVSDGRELAIAFFHLRLFRLVEGEAEREGADLAVPAGSQAGGAAGAVLLEATALRQAVDSLMQDGDHAGAADLLGVHAGRAVRGFSSQAREVRDLTRLCLRLEQAEALASIFESVLAITSVSVVFDARASRDPTVVRCHFLACRRVVLVWRCGLSERPADEMAGLLTIASYVLAVLPLLAAYARDGDLAGSCNLTLADEAHARGLAFCGRPPDSTLIPDPVFLFSRGYQKLIADIGAAAMPWEARRAVALWRGSPTGYRGSGSGILDLPRVRLCLLARGAEAAGFIDAGLTGFAQVDGAARGDLEAAGLQRGFVPPERFGDWKYAIDIDGNSNAWAGLFQKLLSGAVVLKVDGEAGWRQWYYDRLSPFENYVPVAADMSDLAAKIRYLVYNDAYARRIGEAGRALALSMDVEREMAAGVAAIARAIIYELAA
jgi:hypothetical protein